MNEIPFYKPEINETSIELVKEVLAQQNTQNMGRKLEKDVCRYVGANYGVATINQTAALHLSLLALDLKRGDKILCSVNSFPAVAEVVRHFDAEPIFVDIDKDDFNIDIKQLEAALKANTHKKLKALFVNHCAGQSSDLDPIYALAKHYKIKIIDNAAYALGAKYKNKNIGSTGSLITCFNFSPQLRTSIANGGILVTNDEEIYQQATLLKNHALVSDSWDEYGNLGYIYDVVDVGVKYDINELSAAFNIGLLPSIEERIQKRQAIASIYDKELANCPHVQIPIKKRDHIYTKYIIKIDKNRDSFARELKELGIYTGLHYIPLHLLSYYKNKYSLRVNDFPIALSNYQQILSIPIYESMSDESVLRVCEAIKSVAKKRG